MSTICFKVGNIFTDKSMAKLEMGLAKYSKSETKLWKLIITTEDKLIYKSISI